MKYIYADNNATSPLCPPARRALERFATDDFFNPSSSYTPARRVALAVEEAREQIAALAGAEPDELYFTSGGSESNLWAIHIARCRNPARTHWICSAVEHASILEPLAALEREGHRVTRVPVDAEGCLKWNALERAMTPDTALVTVMLANNETGVLYPIEKISGLAHAYGILVHTDAAQALGRIPVSFRALGVDLMTCCAHKMHGPKGVGALFVRDGIEPAPLIAGGGQERGKRAGTENVPAIAGFGAAAAWSQMPMDSACRDIVERGLADLEGVRLVAAATPRLPNTTMFLVEGVETDVLFAALDMAGICASPGSACAAGAPEPSHVLAAMGLAGSGAPVRISWGRLNSPDEAFALVETFRRVVRDLRALR